MKEKRKKWWATIIRKVQSIMLGGLVIAAVMTIVGVCIFILSGSIFFPPSIWMIIMISGMLATLGCVMIYRILDDIVADFLGGK